MRYADLHIHTSFSDGTFSPQQVVRQAKSVGLSCIAVTDHDQVAAIAPAMQEAQRVGLELIPGVEMTAEEDSYELHLLGYFIDWQAEWFKDKLAQLCAVRKQRALKILEKLKKIGITLDQDELLDAGSTGAIGRLHIARMLLKQEVVYSIPEAFNRYLGRGCPCYVDRLRLSPKEAIDMLHKLKAVPVLAHPHTLGNDEIIPRFIELGLKGIEAYYPEYEEGVTAHYLDFAAKYGLLVTGGSDCHGEGKGKIMLGEIKLPYHLVEALKQEAENLRRGQM